MKTKHWIALILIILVLSLGACFLIFGDNAGSQSVQVISDGVVLYTLPLSRARVITVESPYGTNTVTVKDGKAAVTDASCPDHYCMKRGFCNQGPDIICLPNRLVLHFTGAGETDTVIG